MTNITLGQYFPGQSSVHLLDPRTKIICIIVFITSIFLAENYVAYATLFAFVFSMILLAQIPMKFIIKSLKPLWIIILLTLGIHVFTTPGTVLYSFGILTITQEGVRQGLLMCARLLLLIIISSLLTLTTSPMALTDGIEKLLHPFKKIGLPAHELAMMMTIALRFIPTLLEETDRIMKAQMARGADFSSGNILRRAQSMIPLLVPLFISAFRRADELATAMEARCYRGGESRTRMKELKLASRDFFAVLIIVGLVSVLAFLKMGKII